MSETPTIKIPLGFKAPEFQLPDTVSDKELTYTDIRGEKGTVVIFICNHCPYVIHVIHEIVNIAKEYMSKGIGFVAISSNDVENYPQDAPDKMKEHAKIWDFPFSYLYDESQAVAKEYQAACTPDYNIFDANDLCVYRGQLDESRPQNNAPVDGKDLRKALNQLLNHEKISADQKPSVGCNIKWKVGGDALRNVF
jgi:peroxiredoxin